MESIVYKVVQKSYKRDGKKKFISAHAEFFHGDLEYKVGSKTIAKAGYLYAFDTIVHAITYANACANKDFRILRCRAEIEEGIMYPNMSLQEMSLIAMQQGVEYAIDLAFHNACPENFKVEGTVFCNWVIPIERIPYVYKEPKYIRSFDWTTD